MSIPFSTFRLHVNHITQAAQNAELSINESAQNLQTVYTTIRPQSLPAIVSYDASSNRTDNLMFLGGHGDHAEPTLTRLQPNCEGEVDAVLL